MAKQCIVTAIERQVGGDGTQIFLRAHFVELHQIAVHLAKH
jgi:hypothetical protein